MSTKRYAILTVWGLLGLVLLLLALSSRTVASPSEAAGSPGATLQGDSITVCASGECDHVTIQDAVDAAEDGDTIKVAQGVYTSTALQVVYVTKAVTLTGGYTTTDWVNSYPLTQTTVIDAEDVPHRRVLYIDGTGLSTVTLAGLTIQRGYARDGDGGGVYIPTGKVAITNCQILSNTAYGGQGDGLYAARGILTVTNSFFGNDGLYATESVSVTTLTDNTFSDAGVTSHGKTTTLVSNTFSSNSSQCVSISGSTATLTGNIFKDNGRLGAATYVVRILGGCSAALSQNTFEGNSGPALTIEHSTADVRGNSFQSNTATPVNAIQSRLTLTGNSFQGNYGGSYGAVFVYGGTGSVRGNTFEGNSTLNFGGGLYLWECDAAVIGNLFEGNSSGQSGGGIHITDRVTATLASNCFQDNSAGTYGGGVYVRGTYGRSTATLNRNTFEGNSASDTGGAIYAIDSNLTLYGNTILSNTADIAGGGIAISGPGASVNASNDVIADNTSPFEGVYLSGGDLTARHWTLANNGSYALISNRGSATLTNTIVATHTVAGFWGSDITADHTLFFNSGIPCGGGATCTSNFSGDPDFANPAANDYHIGPSSAALDRGVDAGVYTDMDNWARPYQAPDLGADEFWPPSCFLPFIMRRY